MADELLPVSFGFHPYFGIPGLPRGEWRLQLPAMRRLVLDNRGIPTGEEAACDAFDAPLGELNLDDGFVVARGASKILAFWRRPPDHRRVSPELQPRTGFRTQRKRLRGAGADDRAHQALTSGRGLRLIEAGEEFRAAFRIVVQG